MSINDVTIIETGGISATTSRTFRVQDRTTSGLTATIKPGEPIKLAGNYVTLIATGDPEVGTDRMVGIAATESTETASADGFVDVKMIVPNSTVMRCKVTTPGNMDTDAELLAILNDSVTFDVTSGVFTVDENEGDDPDVHGLIILDGDIVNGTVDFILKEGASIGGLV